MNGSGPDSASLTSPDNATSVRIGYFLLEMYLSMASFQRTASWRLETTTIALVLPPKSGATCSRKCSTTISTFWAML